MTATTKCSGSGSSITPAMWDADRQTAECPACGKRVRSHGFQAVLARHAPDPAGHALRLQLREARATLFARCAEDAADDIKVVERAEGGEFHVQDYAQGRKLAVFLTSREDAETFASAKRRERARVIMAIRLAAEAS